MKADVVIIGAGASGLMCAMAAGKQGRSVIVLDHMREIGSKIRISGGGRCNFTNRAVTPAHYLTGNPHFVVSALARYTPSHFIELLDQHGIGYEEREAGRLFCIRSAQQISDMLLEEGRRAGVKFVLGCRIREVGATGSSGAGRFTIRSDQGDFASRALVVASGGLSYPGTGASGFGYGLAMQFGHKVTALRPGLTPFRFTRDEVALFSALSGISLDAAVHCEEVSFRDRILFTHKGLSGPAVLQISSYWDGRSPISFDLLPDVDVGSLLAEKGVGKTHLATLLSREMPRRLARLWCGRYHESRPLNQYSKRELDRIVEGLHRWEILPAGLEGYGKAEVTLGGVDTHEISSKTMESMKVPGLFFTGEVLDVTGQLGGYNLHWAWASGHAAGQAV